MKRRRDTRRLILIGIIAVCAGAAVWFFLFRSPQESENVQEQREQEQKEQALTEGTIPDVSPEKIWCDREGGRYIQIPEGSSMCAQRTNDGGAVCDDGADCEGDCFATDTSPQSRTGVCGDFLEPIGTRAVVSEGNVLETVVSE